MTNILFRYNEAYDAANDAVTKNPNFTKGWHRKALALFKMGSFELALENSLKALELEPNNAEVKKLVDEILVCIVLGLGFD